jgi:hypothetical protein
MVQSASLLATYSEALTGRLLRVFGTSQSPSRHRSARACARSNKSAASTSSCTSSDYFGQSVKSSGAGLTRASTRSPPGDRGGSERLSGTRRTAQDEEGGRPALGESCARIRQGRRRRVAAGFNVASTGRGDVAGWCARTLSCKRRSPAASRHLTRAAKAYEEVGTRSSHPRGQVRAQTACAHHRLARTGRPTIARHVGMTVTRVPGLSLLRLGGWVQLGAALAHKPFVLKATGDPVESRRVVDAELLARLSNSDPGLIHDQSKELLTATAAAGRRRARARARGRGGPRLGRGACARSRLRALRLRYGRDPGSRRAPARRGLWLRSRGAS